MQKIAILLISTLMLSGCYSASLNISAPTHEKRQGSAIRSVKHDDNISFIRIDEYDDNISKTNFKAEEVLTRKDIENLLSKSDKESRFVSEKDFIDYKVRGFRWIGLFPEIIIGFIGFPVPIAIPIGSNYIRFKFDDDKLSYIEVYSHRVIFSTGFFYGYADEGTGRIQKKIWCGSIPLSVSGWVGWDGYSLGENGHVRSSF